jgi:hypothetical protein
VAKPAVIVSLDSSNGFRTVPSQPLTEQPRHALYNVPPSTPSRQPSTPLLFQITMSYSPVHKASLVESSTHSPALLELVDLKLSRPIIGKSYPLLFPLHSLKPYHRAPYRFCHTDRRFCSEPPLTLRVRPGPISFETSRGLSLQCHGQQCPHAG